MIRTDSNSHCTFISYMEREPHWKIVNTIIVKIVKIGRIVHV